jgi:CubicO group peptidase (beta-lactamase class C family)
MPLGKFLHLFLALALVAGQSGVAPVALAQSAAAGGQSQPAQTDAAARVAEIERKFEEQRKEYNVPGASLVVVKDDRVVLLKGAGARDAARGLPVTPDTLFAIGSCTKAFTAMAAVISQDEGKLSLDDSPKKHLPYFALRDPEADAAVKVRDLLSHATGLAGTDIAWYTGALTREEVIRAAGRAKPTAKLREKYQYQNVMYSAAGEVVARAQGSTWEAVVSNLILKPLGMKATVLSTAEMRKAPDYSLGYEIEAATKQARPVATRDLTNIAPAGAINSSAREMSEWLRLLTNGGAHGGRRLVSEKGFQEILTPQIKVNDTADYTLGWVATKVGGRRVYVHTGGIDGFGAMVAFLPEHRLGFAVLANVEGTPLLGQTLRSVVTNMLDERRAPQPAATAPAQAADVRPQDEAGRYDFTAANMIVTVAYENGKLYADVPGQQRYTLEPVSGRRYRLAPLEGFFITFRPVRGRESETEAYLEQPQGNYTLPKLKDAAQANPGAATPAGPYDGPLKELVGTYEGRPFGRIEVKIKGDKIVLTVPDQPDYPLVERERDVLQSPVLPDTYSVLVRRDPAGKASGLVLKQPGREWEFKRAADPAADKTVAPPAGKTPPVSITADELIGKMIAAAGGEANLRAHRSSVAKASVTFEHQGLEGETTIYAQAPHSYAREVTYLSAGKRIGTTREFYDGSSGGEEHSFVERGERWPAKKVEETRPLAAFQPLLDWKTLYKSASIREVSKVEREEVYVLVLTPESGQPITEYVSAKTFLPVRRDTLESPASGGGPQPVTVTLSDYRRVGGVLVPHLLTYQIPGTGETVVRVKEFKFDAPIPAGTFAARK